MIQSSKATYCLGIWNISFSVIIRHSQDNLYLDLTISPNNRVRKPQIGEWRAIALENK